MTKNIEDSNIVYYKKYEDNTKELLENFKFDTTSMNPNIDLKEKLNKTKKKINDEYIKVFFKSLEIIILNFLEENKDIDSKDLIIEMSPSGRYRTYDEILDTIRNLSIKFDSKFSFINNGTRFEIMKKTKEEIDYEEKKNTAITN